MVNLQALIGPAVVGTFGTIGWTNFDLNDADNSLAQRYVFPKDGTITKIGVYCVSITGNPPAYNIGLVTLDAAGFPTAVAHGGGSLDTYDFTGAGWVWHTLATPAAVQAGDIAYSRIWPTGSAPDVSNFARFRKLSTTNWWGAQTPGANYITSWILASWYAMAVEYSDGQVIGLPILDAANSVQFGPTSTPDEYGVMFTVPVKMRCIGVRWGIAATQADQPMTMKLYDGDGSTVLASFALSDEDNFIPGNPFDGFWDPVTLIPGISYRLTMLPGGVGNQWRLNEVSFESANSRSAFPEGTSWQKTSRTDAGAWTQDNTIIPWFALWVDQIDIAKTLAAAAA